MTTSDYPADDNTCIGDKPHLYLVISFNPHGSDHHGVELIRLLTPLAHNNFMKQCRDKQLLFRGPLLTKADNFLTKITTVLDGYNRKKPIEDRAEIIATRARGERLQAIPAEFDISDRFSIVAPGSNIAPGNNQILLDAGNSFGSGYHPSTKLAVRALEKIADKDTDYPGHVIDLGCGSGILSIINILLGAQAVLGLEIDREAVENARRNCTANHMEGRITISDKAISSINDQVDCICANLIISVMLTMLDDFGRLLRPGGKLVLSGIQGRQAGECTHLLEKRGFTCLKDFQNGAWRSLLLQKGH